jgi:LmbE family N-acetylglucosaminyl deacetylase
MSEETQAQVQKLGSILSVWAHPDDETFSAAGIMAMAVKNGQEVVCVTATKGEEGVQDESRWPKKHLAEIREQELLQALNELGVQTHHWLGYCDGTLKEANVDDASQKLLRYIERYKPDSILTFGPEGMTGHPDHQSVSRWVSYAVEQLEHKPAVYHAVIEQKQYEDYLKGMDNKLNIFFSIKQPPVVEAVDCDLCIRLPKEICLKKCAALAQMPSQTAKMHELFDSNFIVEAFRVESFRRAK